MTGPGSRGWRPWFLALNMVVAVTTGTLLGSGGAYASNDSAAAVITAFATEDAGDLAPSTLGTNVGTYLNLQVWRTLQRTYVDERMTHSRGTVWWQNATFDSHANAERAARDLLAQMTLWGTAFEFGDGVIVQAFLSIPKYNDFRRDSNEAWSIELLGERLVVDLPRRRYDFSPIEISRASVEDLRDPFAFKLCGEKTRSGDDHESCRPGRLSKGFEALRHDSDCSLVVTLDADREQGWICDVLPSDRNSEVADFVGGILRLMRGDWPGAEDSFNAVIGNADAEQRLKVDARLMLASVHARSDRPSDSLAQSAFDLRPNDAVAFKYLVMSKLDALRRQVELSQPTAGLAGDIEQLLASNRVLLSPEDPWLQALDAVLDAVTSR